jgi:pyruvoyl-dependent arginine decarboxylase (PvlArgDC)
MQRHGVSIDFIIDINPVKQGKFAPGSGCEIISPVRACEELNPGAHVFVMNSNYIKEITELSNNLFDYIRID